eukprot:scaffold2813_cov210-Prasinococcus_capsulatus_cf.AAC.4
MKEPYDIGDVSFHSGRIFHRAGIRLGDHNPQAAGSNLRDEYDPRALCRGEHNGQGAKGDDCNIH